MKITVILTLLFLSNLLFQVRGFLSICRQANTLNTETVENTLEESQCNPIGNQCKLYCPDLFIMETQVPEDLDCEVSRFPTINDENLFRNLCTFNTLLNEKLNSFRTLDNQELTNDQKNILRNALLSNSTVLSLFQKKVKLLQLNAVRNNFDTAVPEPGYYENMFDYYKANVVQVENNQMSIDVLVVNSISSPQTTTQPTTQATTQPTTRTTTQPTTRATTQPTTITTTQPTTQATPQTTTQPTTQATTQPTTSQTTTPTTQTTTQPTSSSTSSPTSPSPTNSLYLQTPEHTKELQVRDTSFNNILPKVNGLINNFDTNGFVNSLLNSISLAKNPSLKCDCRIFTSQFEDSINRVKEECRAVLRGQNLNFSERE